MPTCPLSTQTFSVSSSGRGRASLSFALWKSQIIGHIGVLMVVETVLIPPTVLWAPTPLIPYREIDECEEEAGDMAAEKGSQGKGKAYSAIA